MHWPRRAWVARTLLAAHLLFPAVALALGFFTDTPEHLKLERRWFGHPPLAEALDALLVVHLVYASALGAILSGRCGQAFLVGACALLASKAAGIAAYLHVTQAYF